MIGDSEIEVIDNFLSPLDFRKITTKVLKYDFPWYYFNHVNYTNDSVGDYNFQFVHPVFHDCQSINSGVECIKPVLDRLNVTALIRVKFNLNPRTSELIEHGYHVDNLHPASKSAILYLNSNDGYTIFDGGKKVDSVENRLVKFDATIPHSGTSCTNEKRRIVLNINYF